MGFQWHWSRRADAASLETALPAWALRTLGAHAGDSGRGSTRPRSSRPARPTTRSGTRRSASWWRRARSTTTCGCCGARRCSSGRASPAEAYRTLEHLNNKYALDGRDPNSSTGILWCFGLFDRPWAPERPVLGTVRYMSSENTARKFELEPYYAYVERLPTIAEARSGRPRKARRRP